ASAFATVAQLRMWEGDPDGAIVLYDRGMQLAHHDSYFHRYLLVLKMQAELALKHSKSSAAELLFSLAPAEGGENFLLWAPIVTDNARADVSAYIDRLDTMAATTIIRHQHYLAARHFRYETHRKNI